MTTPDELSRTVSSLSDEALDQLFRTARTYSFYLSRPVEEATLRQLYELVKWGPTSANTCPARFLFVRSPEARKRLVPCLAPANVDKVLSAPVTVIIGADFRFYDKLPKLFPHAPTYKDRFEKSPELSETTARRNSSLQGAYLILAARALGLDCGPMSGFDNAKLDAEFFGAGKEIEDCNQEFFPLTHVRSNFLCNLGYGDPAKLFPRSPRLDFEEACALLELSQVAGHFGMHRGILSASHAARVTRLPPGMRRQGARASVIMQDRRP